MNRTVPEAASFAAPSPSLRRLVAAEGRKLFSSRAWLWMLLASTAWTILYSALAIAFNGVGEPSLSGALGQRTLLAIGAGGAGPLVAILGAVGVTSEFRHRTATTTFLAIPRRGYVAAAKVATYLLAGVGYALLCLAVNLAIAVPWLAARRIGIAPSGLGDIGVITAVVVSVALFGVAGVGLGLLCRAQLATVMALLIYLYVVEPLISHIAVIHGFTQYLPGVAADGLTQATQSGVLLLSPWMGGLVFAGYGVALVLAGTWLTLRRDIA